MTQQEIDRIECAIRHIQSSLDVDPWAMDIAVAAMKKQIPERPIRKSLDFVEYLFRLFCPNCGTYIGSSNSRVKYLIKVYPPMKRCIDCGQVIDWSEREDGK